MDSLPVWAQPHRFWRLREHGEAVMVFTFGLLLTELRHLGSGAGVAIVGRRFGYEWLTSHAIPTIEPPTRTNSQLAQFLHDEIGIAGTRNQMTEKWANGHPSIGEPSPAALEEFAAHPGQQIREWSLNAFGGLETTLAASARSRVRVADGYGATAERLLNQTQMPHRLVTVNAIDGTHHWSRRYDTLLERVALELEDLAIRRPRAKICPLCQRIFIPIVAGQQACANNLWRDAGRTLLERCTPTSDTEAYTAAASLDYQRRRKTAWTAMNRARKRHGHNHPTTLAAQHTWDLWRETNKPPRTSGRPRATPATPTEAPYAPKGDDTAPER